MGSERMRSYRIAYLLVQDPQGRDPVAAGELAAELRRFEEVLAGLKAGDPARPLVLPRDGEILAELAGIDQQWRQSVKPLVLRIAGGDAVQRTQLMPELRVAIESFVERIDQVVRLAEMHNARNIS